MRKILIVDDDSLVLHTLARHLSNEHTEVKTSETGYDALSNVLTNFYNLCLLDIKLPDISGLEVMKKIKVMSPGTKVVIMTADYITDEMKREIQNTAYGFVSKPFDLSQIKTISEELVYGDENIKERRQVKRNPSLDTINYYVVIFEDKEMKVLELKGDIIDISNRGIGIRTDYLLTPGYMIRFSDETQFRAGVVRWSMSVGNNSHCAGVEFVDYKEAPWFR
jgi:CheY-like chemotaxis protein